MNEVTPDNAARATPVAWAVPAAITKLTQAASNGRDTWFDVWSICRVPYTEPLYSAATVTALEAEVERLRKYSERLSSELSEMAQVCGEAYQVVGILLDETKQFGSEHGDKILTNLWEGKLIHKDVIPWSFKEDRNG